MNRAETLDAARQAVLQDRSATHGEPEDSFGLIAELWSALLAQDITRAQVCLMLATLKVARAWDNPLHDENWIDLAGYAACGAETATIPDTVPACTPPQVGAAQQLALDVAAVHRWRWMLPDNAPAAQAPVQEIPPLAVDPSAQAAEGGCKGDGNAAETATMAEAVPTSATQDGPEPSPLPLEGAKAAPGPARSLVNGIWKGPYTEDEEAEIVRRVARGETSRHIASVLKRSDDALRQIIRGRLADRIAQAKHDAAMASRPAPVPEAAGNGKLDAAKKAESAHDIAKAKLARLLRAVDYGEAPPDNAAEYIALVEAARSPKGAWTREQDCELIRLALLQWRLPQVAQELGQTEAECRARHMVLTCGKHFKLADIAQVMGVEL